MFWPHLHGRGITNLGCDPFGWNDAKQSNSTRTSFSDVKDAACYLPNSFAIVQFQTSAVFSLRQPSPDIHHSLGREILSFCA